MTCLRRFIVAAVFAALLSGSAEAAAYSTERGLYKDCNAGTAASADLAAKAALARCTDYLKQVLDGWNLEQDNGICARYVGRALPPAYVDYWRARGKGFIGGTFTSAERSVKEFLDSEKVRCPTADLKTNPP